MLQRQGPRLISPRSWSAAPRGNEEFYPATSFSFSLLFTRQIGGFDGE
jgi:hypothetical protein